MDPTKEQLDKIAELKQAFGKDVIKAHARSAATGCVRVEATAKAGVWQWSLNAEGEMVHASLDMKLFEQPQEERKPRNATDN